MINTYFMCTGIYILSIKQCIEYNDCIEFRRDYNEEI